MVPVSFCGAPFRNGRTKRAARAFAMQRGPGARPVPTSVRGTRVRLFGSSDLSESCLCGFIGFIKECDNMDIGDPVRRRIVVPLKEPITRPIKEPSPVPPLPTRQPVKEPEKV